MMRVASVCSGIGGAELAFSGHRNGRLTAVSVAGKAKDGHLLWLCRCDCGNTNVVASNHLQRDAGTKSCGCLRREAANRRLLRDGAWNDGKSYAILDGQHCYKSRASWAKAAVKAYGNKCERCGWAEARCDVHHRHAKAKGGLHTIANAIVLCPNCHRVEHEGLPK